MVQLVECVGGRALDTWTHLVTWTQGHTDRQGTANVPQITGSDAKVGSAASSTLQLLVVQELWPPRFNFRGILGYYQTK